MTKINSPVHVAIYVKPYLYLVANVSFKPSFSNGESFNNCEIPVFNDIYNELLNGIVYQETNTAFPINNYKRIYLSQAANVSFSKFFESVKRKIDPDTIPILISTLDTFNNEIPIDLFVLEIFQHQYL